MGPDLHVEAVLPQLFDQTGPHEFVQAFGESLMFIGAEPCRERG